MITEVKILPPLKDVWIITEGDQINFTQLAKVAMRVQPADIKDSMGWVRVTSVTLVGGQVMTFLGDASKKFDDLWKEQIKNGAIDTI